MTATGTKLQSLLCAGGWPGDIKLAPIGAN